MPDRTDIVRHKKYTMTDPDGGKGVGGNNKFWYIWEFADGSMETQWGRIGVTASVTSYSPGKKNFDKFCAEKEKKGYREAQVIGSNVGGSASTVSQSGLKKAATEQIKYTSPVVKELLDLLVQRNKHQIMQATTMVYDEVTGLFGTPLGPVTRDAISDARDILVNISSMLGDLEDFSTRKLCSDYLMLIPTKIAPNKNPMTIFEDSTVIQKQGQILDSLEASIDHIEAQGQDKPKESKVASIFNVELDLVEDATVMTWIREMYRKTKSNSHECRHLDVKRAFRLKIGGMAEAWEKDGAKMDNVWDLWHGTRVSNVLSLMSKGFFIPPASASYCCGRAYGDGVYFSDQSTKSLNYAYGYWDGGARDQNCFMLINKVAMGKFYIPRNSSDRPLPRAGYDSTFAKAGQSGVMNNEMIVYRTSQICPEYLVEFSPNGK